MTGIFSHAMWTIPKLIAKLALPAAVAAFAVMQSRAKPNLNTSMVTKSRKRKQGDSSRTRCGPNCTTVTTSDLITLKEEMPPAKRCRRSDCITSHVNHSSCQKRPINLAQERQSANKADECLHQYKDVTRLIHNGQEPEQWNFKAVVPPVVNSTTFAQHRPGQGTYVYSRSANPTRDCLESSLASCEDANYALAFASGLGASTSIAFLLRSGDHILATSGLYGGTNRLFTKCLDRMNITLTLADSSSNVDEFLSHIIPGKTKMIWIETPTNPMMSISDIAAVALRCRQDNILLVVDNTFATPVFQKPLALGADIVVHSATKYLNGHSDVVMGCVMMNREDIYPQWSLELHSENSSELTMFYHT